MFNDCGETGYAPFFLSRASLKSGEERLADLLKAEQVGMSWRTGFALINQYTANNQWQQAVETGKKYIKKYPSNYYIGLKYAKALCETGQYQPCISLLNKMQVLPNEGSYAGRAVYRAANLYQAMEQLSRKNYRQVMRNVEASKEWPENLGVGKPYDDMIDSRLEDYLEAKALTGQGDNQKAATLLSSVAGYKTSRSRFGSGNLLTALALRELGKKRKRTVWLPPGKRISLKTGLPSGVQPFTAARWKKPPECSSPAMNKRIRPRGKLLSVIPISI